MNPGITPDEGAHRAPCARFIPLVSGSKRLRSLLACLFKGGQRLGEVQLPEGAESVKEGVGSRMQIHLHLRAIGQRRFLLQLYRAPAYDSA